MPNASLFINCSIVILAGGQGQRMAGQDKGWVLWQGKPLVEYIQHVVRPLTDDLIISCNRNIQRYQSLCDQTVSDPEQNYAGPLAGMLAALKIARHDYVIFLPCDAPRIDTALLQSLYQQVQQSPVMLRQQGFWQPLFSAVPKSALPKLQQAWDNGERRPRMAFAAIGAQAIECADDDQRLANFNEPALLTQNY